MVLKKSFMVLKTLVVSVDNLLCSSYIHASSILQKLLESQNKTGYSPYIGEYVDELFLFYSKCYQHIESLVSLYGKAYQYAQHALSDIMFQDDLLAR